MKNTKLVVTDDDLLEIARQITEGYTSGIVDADGTRISWSVAINKFSH